MFKTTSVAHALAVAPRAVRGTRVAHAKPEKRLWTQLELEQDERHERWERRALGVGKCLCAAFVLAAALGITGPGWLSHRRVASGGVELIYSQNVHRARTTTLELAIDAEHARDGELRLRLPRAWLEQMRLEEIEPPPLRDTLLDEERELVFAVAGSRRLQLSLHVEPRGWGRVAGEVAVVGGPRIPWKQVVFP